MTDDQADELLRKNDWSKWSDARELLMEAAHIGAMDERKNLDAELRRLAKVEAQRDVLLRAIRWIATVNAMDYEYQDKAQAALEAVEENT